MLNIEENIKYQSYFKEFVTEHANSQEHSTEESVKASLEAKVFDLLWKKQNLSYQSKRLTSFQILADLIISLIKIFYPHIKTFQEIALENAKKLKLAQEEHDIHQQIHLNFNKFWATYIQEQNQMKKPTDYEEIPDFTNLINSQEDKLMNNLMIKLYQHFLSTVPKKLQHLFNQQLYQRYISSEFHASNQQKLPSFIELLQNNIEKNQQAFEKLLDEFVGLEKDSLEETKVSEYVDDFLKQLACKQKSIYEKKGLLLGEKNSIEFKLQVLEQLKDGSREKYSLFFSIVSSDSKIENQSEKVMGN